LSGGMVQGGLYARALLAAEASGAHLSEEWAWLSYASLHRSEREAGRVAASPVLGTIPWLRLEAGNAALEALLDSPHLRGVHTLTLRHTRLDDAGVRLVAGSPNLQGLRTLDLGDNRFGDSGLASLAAAPHLGQLRTLELAKVRFAQ